MLLARGAPADQRVGDEAMTPLAAAAAAGHTRTVRVLLEACADVNAATGNGNTPLAWARQGGHVAVTERLLRAGATPLVAKPPGDTGVALSGDAVARGGAGAAGSAEVPPTPASSAQKLQDGQATKDATNVADAGIAPGGPGDDPAGKQAAAGGAGHDGDLLDTKAGLDVADVDLTARAASTRAAFGADKPVVLGTPREADTTGMTGTAGATDEPAHPAGHHSLNLSLQLSASGSLSHLFAATLAPFHGGKYLVEPSPAHVTRHSAVWFGVDATRGKRVAIKCMASATAWQCEQEVRKAVGALHAVPLLDVRLQSVV